MTIPGLVNANGVAFYEGTLYIAQVDQIWFVRAVEERFCPSYKCPLTVFFSVDRWPLQADYMEKLNIPDDVFISDLW